MRPTKIFIIIILLQGIALSCRKDHLPPEVSIRIPENDTVVHEGHSFQLLADAEDDKEVSLVRLFIGNREIETKTAPPYLFTVNSSGIIGSHEILVMALDREGNTGKSDPIHIDFIPNLLPYPSLRVEPRIAWINQPVSFKVDSTTDADDNFDELLFRFDWENDGIWDTEWAAMDSIPHIYNEMGHYEVLMEAKDPQGNISKTSKKIIIWGEFIDPRDGKTYPVIKLGENIWFAQNLAYRPVSGSTGYVESDQFINYGRLYGKDSATWVCPEGWHLSSMEEWYDLQVFAGLEYEFRDSFEIMSESLVGLKLKSEADWKNNKGGYDDYGFRVFPAGYGNAGRYDGTGLMTAFWTSSRNDYDYLLTRAFDWQHTGILPGSGGGTTFLSIRCVKGTGTPGLRIFEIMDNTYPSIKIESEITNPNGEVVSQSGLCWNNTGIPDLNDKNIHSDILRGVFPLEINGLNPADTLYVRAYAINNAGTGYSETEMVILHDSSGILLDERDMQEYKTIKIGHQWWMAENLNYVPDSGSFCYEGRQSNCDKYGRLYPWDTAKIVCPEGWHLPSDQEWMDLELHLGMPANELNNESYLNRSTGEVGKKLKSRSHWPYKWSMGTDEVGFNALPSGWAYKNYTQIGYGTHFWTSSKGQYNPIFRYIYPSEGIGRSQQPSYNLYSVRCLKNQ